MRSGCSTSWNSQNIEYAQQTAIAMLTKLVAVFELLLKSGVLVLYIYIWFLTKSRIIHTFLDVSDEIILDFWRLPCQ